jgi:hypothetical protein
MTFSVKVKIADGLYKQYAVSNKKFMKADQAKAEFARQQAEGYFPEGEIESVTVRDPRKPARTFTDAAGKSYTPTVHGV